MILIATVSALVLAACGGLSERSYETESGSWVLYTQPRLQMGGQTAEVFGFVEMDRTTGCVYLGQPEFDISYPSVWPAGTFVTDTGLRLSDGEKYRMERWVCGGGGYVAVGEVEDGEDSEQGAVLERCHGVKNRFGEVAEFDSPAGDIEIGE